MPAANTNVSDIIATTIQARNRKNADNLTNNSALLMVLRERGNVRPLSGGNVILEEIIYNDATTNQAGSYSGYDLLPTTPNSPISAFEFLPKQYVSSPIMISGLEELMNGGKEQMIDLLESRIRIAEAQLTNSLTADLYGDGTGNGGKNLVGMQAAVADSPATGVYGGIDRAVWTFARNISFDATTDGGAAASASNIQSYMGRVVVQLIRGKNRPDIIAADNNYYRLYLESMQAIQRVTNETSKMAGAGFPGLAYFGAGMNAMVYLDGGIGGGCPANHMYFLNSEFIYWRPFTDRNFVPIGPERTSINQDARLKYIGWAGALTSSGPQFNGILKD